MARFSANDVDNYGSKGNNGGFFQITKDKQVKQVRIMYNSIDDVEGLSVHKIKYNGKDRYVNCLREYNDPLDVCPFCREKIKTEARLFIPVYNIEEDKAQIWDRGKTMFPKITSLCSRYGSKNNLVNYIFDVERHGVEKDTNTTYEFYSVEKDDTELEDLPEIPTVIGKIVLDKTAEDMEYYLEQGDFPPTEDEEEEEAPVRRGSDRSERTESRNTGRRTPANSRHSDAF